MMLFSKMSVCAMEDVGFFFVDKEDLESLKSVEQHEVYGGVQHPFSRC